MRFRKLTTNLYRKNLLSTTSKNENVGSHDRLAPVVHSAFIACSDGAGGFMEMLHGKLENIFLKCFITVLCFVCD